MEFSREHVKTATFVLGLPLSFAITNTRLILKETIELLSLHPINIFHSQCKAPALYGPRVRASPIHYVSLSTARRLHQFLYTKL